MKNGIVSAVAALAFAAAAVPASAAVYNLDVYSAGFTPPLGTVTVTGEGTNVLSFDIDLADGVFFQLTGNGSLHDSFWFDLVGNPTVAYNITSPDGAAPGTGDYPIGGLFTGAQGGSYGQGFIQNYDYAIQGQDTSGGVEYYGGNLTFTVTASAGTQLNFATRDINGVTVVAGADLRQCPVGTTGQCVTGPVGASGGGGSLVPEPATWAMMITGFGGVGAMMRRRKLALASI